MKSGFQNWSDVRVFLAVVRTGSTLAASKSLGMAQPTVARRIDALEQSLGLTLFDRDTRGFHVTRAGSGLVAAAEEMEAAAHALDRKASTARKAASRRIRITAPSNSFTTNFAAILSDFSAQHPGTSFELISTFEVLDLAAGDADVALRFARNIDDDRLICTRLTEVRSSLYAAPGYARRHGVPRTEHEFGAHRFVLSDSPRAMLHLSGWVRKRVDPGQIVTEGSTVEAILTAVLAGLGIGPLPNSVAVDHPSLIRCIDTPEGTSVCSWLVISPQAWERPEVKAFAKFFAPRFRALFRNLR